MCGIFGIMWNAQEKSSKLDLEQLKQLTNLITHRGPDDEGFYEDEFVSLCFKRLSIIDIHAGHQPLSYEDGRYWIIFNGEIYNYLELREELIVLGYQFKTNTDTEVILAGYSAWKEKVLNRLRGMFAFVIWDTQTGQLFGARDPFGIKGFYYYEDKEKLIFSSESKVILNALKPEWNYEVSQTSLQQYLSFQYVPEPATIFEGIKKLEPSHYFVKKLNEPMTIKRYWSNHFEVKKQNEEEVYKQIRNALFDSVKLHMRSDVPVGSFLSGGIDSSAIVSIAKEFHPKLKTFSVGFEREGYSEVDVAKETADALGLENISYIITPEEFLNELPKIVWHLDDPLADPAAVPLYFVAREAKKHVTVVLSGEGADELFGGYNIYREPISLKPFNYVPSYFKKIIKQLSIHIPETVKGKNYLLRGCTPLEERYIGNAKVFEEMEKKLVLKDYHSGIHYQDITKPFYQNAIGYPAIDKMQYIDINTWLRGDILLKADKMTMAHSLELRVPFLDKEVFRVASSLEPTLKTREGTTKFALRQAVKGIVPDHVLNRKKLGFPVPIGHWFKDELYDWAVNLIKTSHTDHFFNKQTILKLLEDHRKGERDNSRKLWTIFIFMMFQKVFIENEYEFDKKAALQLQ
ncbi:asparagine synthase (glutamine-hydrolyzing) [Bacillus sp. RG28]|uniref:asparagine synthase (glutamine-hydrolyzing) n=1 Tax=Gottfriedia endophytica TaxID=2820819 RepID=A0A940SKW8_9BACI|nr:asparagine synthase (glutamine-hydrolyzing) [Gottfriedia endophytica]MBP0725703.1 asparagine synthase (glutamine-hydrolyzing) [Gottfriedia endophytica]